MKTPVKAANRRIASILMAISLYALPCFATSPNEIMIKVKQDGVYYISATEIGQALGLSYGDAKSLLSTYEMSLLNGTGTVACIQNPDGEGFYFYGRSIDSIYTSLNAYRMVWANRLDMQAVSAAGSTITTNSTFTDHRHFEKDSIAVTGYFSSPESDYWIWAYANPGDEDTDNDAVSMAFDLPAVSSDAVNASIQIKLYGAISSGLPDEHKVSVILNGTSIGDVVWTGKTCKDADLTFSQSLLVSGSNNLSVTAVLNSGISNSIIYIDSFDLTYSRKHSAYANQLLFNLADATECTISGFSTNSIGIIGLRDNAKPEGLTDFSTDYTNGSWCVSFQRIDGITNYAAFTLGTGLMADEIKAVSDKVLMSTTNIGTYIIITSKDLAPAAQKLAEYRTGQGLASKVVLTSDIYNEFSAGISTPYAIKDFLQYAVNNWAKPPKYVLLAGSGSYDYKDNLAKGECIIPVMLFNTGSGMFGCDTWFTDLDGNAAPDLSIGRIPAMTENELELYVNRLKTYEGSNNEIWRKTIVLTADNPDSGGDFRFTSDKIADKIPNDYAVTKIYVSNANSTACNSMLISSFNDGALLINYIGHSGVNFLTQDTPPLLSTNDIPFLVNSNKLPIVTGMSCVLGRYEIPGYSCLAEELLMAENGGAIAVWSPSGLAYNDESDVLGSEFYKQITQDKEKILGNVVSAANKAYHDKNLNADTLRIFNLLGEPAMLLQSVGIADDNPYALPMPELKLWKAEAFTASEQSDVAVCGDFSDPDGDGIANIAEYVFARDPMIYDSTNEFELINSDLQISRDYDLIMQVKQRKNLSGIQTGIKVSNDLVSWNDGTSSIAHTRKTDDGNGLTEHIQYYLKRPEGTKTWFVRLYIQRTQ